jgi:hypothetical protein
VEIAFGRRSLEGSGGLYTMSEYCGQDKGADTVRWATLLDSVRQSQIKGIILDIRGFIAIVTIPRGNPESLVRAMGKTSFYDFTNARLRHHPKSMSYDVHETGARLDLSIQW